MIEIRLPRESDYAPVKRLLAGSQLPVDDFVPAHIAFVASDDDRPVGAIGCEAFGKTWLLRSLVVDKEQRSRGLGARLVAALEDRAREQGTVEIWLLTNDAADFFESLGYRRRQRDEAPGIIRRTAEFAELCPASAILMSRSMG